ncbi:uncharacterized protein LACBIDRAFT_329333 [Laccaria bicolor S238N-H82]|uniref:Predicted protein n=1 Tax=Laccaria bicolor (strain S238N-H82 / ATCC MYA-4686) TaxID=486041 RepID=B0DHP9_LACBS|nr:uncharacterized protein LACBIDRAFT_329333 [Laccaria bicolor S238N-H82]EDR05764.1 predicted protein [Laccaria bicolor S238N-H82]|eukprot:XP_001883440.1 predicted protein [Laccaria bicolor S238N-H82]
MADFALARGAKPRIPFLIKTILGSAIAIALALGLSGPIVSPASLGLPLFDKNFSTTKLVTTYRRAPQHSVFMVTLHESHSGPTVDADSTESSSSSQKLGSSGNQGTFGGESVFLSSEGLLSGDSRSSSGNEGTIHLQITLVACRLTKTCQIHRSCVVLVRTSPAGIGLTTDSGATVGLVTGSTYVSQDKVLIEAHASV